MNFIEIFKQNLDLDLLQTTDALQQFNLIENTLIRIIPFINDDNKKVISSYFTDQMNLRTQINNKQKELQKLMDEYGDNTKKIYENFIKKL